MSLTNAAIAELLARRAEEADGYWKRALSKASRAAYTWREEVAGLVAEGRSATELWRVGPKVEALLLEWLEDPPEVPEPAPTRSGFMTMADALATISQHPDWRRDLQGDLQMHTVYSDGRATVEEMARAGIADGLDYFAITDHSKGLKIAGGMTEDVLLAQGREIEDLNRLFAAEGSGFVLLRSLEMNLMPDGSGDMDPVVLRGLDLVLGSFHSQLRKTEDQTERYLAALDNPDIQVLGHPRGRIYNFRRGLTAQWERVFAAAAARGKALEIDCYPDRQDLDVELLTAAREAGGFFSIGTDSHHPGELAFLEIGVAAAIRAGIPRERILNFMPAEQVRQWAREVRSRA